ncbi:hypothetical protein HZS_2 [Henneguya salminicola]|nr:hypothetical protein HZS_2 [Henneguya salminicola]
MNNVPSDQAQKAGSTPFTYTMPILPIRPLLVALLNRTTHILTGRNSPPIHAKFISGVPQGDPISTSRFLTPPPPRRIPSCTWMILKFFQDPPRKNSFTA